MVSQTKAENMARINDDHDPGCHEWARTTLGFVPAQDIAEYIDPWVAEVTATPMNE